MSLFWRLVATRDLRRSFDEVRHGHRYVPLGLQTIPVAELRVRKEPLLIPRDPDALSRVYEVPHMRMENPIERFFPLVNGVQDRRLKHTPHVSLLREFLDTGRIPDESDYVRLMRVRARLQGRYRDQEFLDMKSRRLVAIFNSIRRKGYRRARHWNKPIVVFERPMHPPTQTYSPMNWEVFDGHHRAAALVSLGVDHATVLVARAVAVKPYKWDEDRSWDEELWATLGEPAPGTNMENSGCAGGAA